MIISSLDSVIIAENDGLGNAVEKKTGTSGYSYNACTHRKNCKKKNICGIECTRKSAYSCRFCSHCNTSCTDFKEVCTVLNKAPYKSLFPVILTDNGSEFSNPKGSSFDDLTQDDVNRMMDHINSYKRKKLNNRSPYEAFHFYYGETALAKLGCSPVSPDEIILKPSLLK